MTDKHKIVASTKMTKYGNPFTRPYPFWHLTTINKLKSILTTGLISPNYANRIGKNDFTRNFDSSWNANTISLMSNTSSRRAIAPEVAILVNRQIKTEKLPGYTKKDTNRPVPEEVVARDVIKPEEFIGLVIGEVGYSYKLERSIKPNPLNIDNVVDVIKSIDPMFSLPIYFKGKIVWPQ